MYIYTAIEFTHVYVYAWNIEYNETKRKKKECNIYGISFIFNQVRDMSVGWVAWATAIAVAVAAFYIDYTVKCCTI